MLTSFFIFYFFKLVFDRTPKSPVFILTRIADFRWQSVELEQVY